MEKESPSTPNDFDENFAMFGGMGMGMMAYDTTLPGEDENRQYEEMDDIIELDEGMGFDNMEHNNREGEMDVRLPGGTGGELIAPELDHEEDLDMPEEQQQETEAGVPVLDPGSRARVSL